MLWIGFYIGHRWPTFDTERMEHMYNIPITEIILPFLCLFTHDTVHTCIIFAGLTFRRVQLSLYTCAYFNPGTLRLKPFSARSRSSANTFSIVFQPNWWSFRVKSLAPSGLELYRAAIMFFSYKGFRTDF